jgi:replicative DNA helicase
MTESASGTTYSLECEEALLGALLLFPHLMDELPETFISDYFYNANHLILFNAMDAAYILYKTFDIPILLSLFDNKFWNLRKHEEKLLRFANESTNPNNFLIYAEIITEKYHLRQEETNKL